MKTPFKPVVARAVLLTLGASTLLSAAAPFDLGSIAHAQRRDRPTALSVGTQSSVERDIALLQGALGRTLTTTEIAAITQAAADRDAALTAALTTFNTSVAAIAGLSVADLQTQIAAIKGKNKNKKDLASVLATILGRALTTAETTALATAVSTRNASITATLVAYRAALAGAVGLTATALETALAAYQTGYCAGAPGAAGYGNLLQLLPTILGRALTTTETTAITAAATTRDAALSAASNAFYAQVAAAVGLTTADLMAYASSIGKRGHGNLTVVLQTLLGRSLTATELTALNAAATTRDAANAAAVTAYRAAVAAAVGLSVADLDAAILAASGGRGGGKGGRH